LHLKDHLLVGGSATTNEAAELLGVDNLRAICVKYAVAFLEPCLGERLAVVYSPYLNAFFRLSYLDADLGEVKNLTKPRGTDSFAMMALLLTRIFLRHGD